MTDPEPLAPPIAAAAPVPMPAPQPTPARQPSRGWWRRNRIAVFALPVALAVTFAAAGDRLVDYWWTSDLRIEDARAAAGEAAWLTGVPPYFDVVEDDTLLSDEPPTRIGVVLLGIDRLSSLDGGFEELPIPDGAAAYSVELGFHAEQPVDTYCTLMLVGADGARYGEDNDPLNQYAPCTRLDETGTSVSGPEGEWRNSFTVLTAADAELTEARLTYDGVHYVTLELPDGF